MRVLVINGPNLNLLGSREPEFYGTATMADCIDVVKKGLPNAELSDFQSNHEGEIIDAIHEARETQDAIIINAGAFSHYSHAIRDALEMYDGVKVEVHLSNPYAREEFRRTSVISPVVNGVIAGFKIDSYALAALAVENLLGKSSDA
jgi:3-dehydroquinate dehydratase-2